MFFNFNDILYLLPLGTLIIYYFREFPSYAGTLFVTLLLKVLFALIMLYLILYRYDYGDLNTYFDLAVRRSENFTIEQFYFQGPYLIASLNALIFYVFGSSYFGLSIVMALLAHYSISNIIFSFSRQFSPNVKLTRMCLLLVNLFPFIGLQSTFIGKDPWVLFLLSLVVSRLGMRNKDIVPLGIFCVLILLIRPYQGILTGLVLGIIYFSTKKWFTPRTILVIVAGLLFGTFASTFLELH